MKSCYKKGVKRIIKANKLHNPANPFRNKIVSDAEYNMTYNTGSSSWELDNKTPITCASETANIIVVLESPHVDEFAKAEKEPLPLYNDQDFKQYLGSLINGSKNLNPSQSTPLLNTATSYKVYLINAIQLQCSLGVPTKCYRDLVFLYYWDRLKSNFKTRLESYINDNTIVVINLCTQGRHDYCRYIYNSGTKKTEDIGYLCNKKFIQQVYDANSQCNSLQDLVQESINEVVANRSIQNLKKATGNHPCTWMYKKNRKIRIV